MNGKQELKMDRQIFLLAVIAIVILAVLVALWASVEFAGVIIALSLGLAGIFQDSIRSYLYRPVLKTIYESGIPYGHKVASRSSRGDFVCYNYYFRIKIENIGNAGMRDVEIIAEECHKEVSPGRYEKVEDFIPLNLSWSHRSNERIMPFIRDDFYWFLSLGYIRKSADAGLGLFDKFINGTPFEVVCTLDTIPQPNSGEHILVPGDYKLGLVITGKNLKPERRLVRLHLEDGWEDDRDLMFNRNVLSINEYADSN